MQRYKLAHFLGERVGSVLAQSYQDYSQIANHDVAVR